MTEHVDAPADDPTTIHTPEEYRVAVSECIHRAGTGYGWNRRFLEALAEHELRLSTRMAVGAKYPDGFALQAPYPFANDDPQWSVPSYIVWKQ